MVGNTDTIIMTRRAKMPMSCMGGGDYYRIAVVEIDRSQLRDGDVEPRMISQRARGVVRIVETWERMYRGSTERCAFAQAMLEAEALVGV